MSASNTSLAFGSETNSILRGVSRKGHPLILYKGHKYGIRKRFLNDNIKWICTLSKCSGSIMTDKTFRVYQEIGVHNHLPVPLKTQEIGNFKPIQAGQTIEELNLKPWPAQTIDSCPTSKPDTSWNSSRSPSPKQARSTSVPNMSLLEALQKLARSKSPVSQAQAANFPAGSKLYAALCMPSPPSTTKVNGYHSETVKTGVPQSGGGGQVVQSPGGGSPGPAPVPSVKKAVTAPPPPPAAPPEVCLRWNSYHSNMQATFPSLLNNEQFVDVTLACEGRSIKCHKVMLSACSSYFEELLSQNPCQHPIIFMRDLKFWEVQALVEFMYTGEVNVAQDKLPSLLTAAEALQIKGLTNPGGGTGSGSTGSYAASQEDDSNTTPEIDDVSSPSYCPPTKKIRKRKATNPTSYHQKAQAVYSPVAQQSSPISSPLVHQVTAPPGLTPMRMIGQPTLGIVPQLASQAAPAAHSTTAQPPTAHPGTQQTASQPRLSQTQQRVKKDPGSPPHSHLPPPHPPYTPSCIKSEPMDDNMDTPLDFSESESRKEINASQPADEPLSLATNDQGPGSNGSQGKAQDNGLSEDDDQTGSECSDSGAMHIDPGESSDA